MPSFQWCDTEMISLPTASASVEPITLWSKFRENAAIQPSLRRCVYIYMLSPQNFLAGSLIERNGNSFTPTGTSRRHCLHRSKPQKHPAQRTAQLKSTDSSIAVVSAPVGY